MTKLSLIALAASAAFLPAAAQAQEPPARAPGPHHWGPRGHGQAERVVTRVRHDGPRVEHRGPGRRFEHVRRIDRGGMVPHMWWGPQFHVRNWGLHGFPQPFHGGRWIRYYDDALLIDGHGRVHDGRYGWDWDREGDRWGYDSRGVPVYVGDGDYEPEDWDYEWAERWERGEGRDRYARRGPPPGHGYGYGAQPGYGYGCGCGPVVITETTTTTAPVVEQVTWYEYVEEAPPRAATKRVVRKPARAPRKAAPPRPGERG